MIIPISIEENLFIRNILMIRKLNVALCSMHQSEYMPIAHGAFYICLLPAIASRSVT